MANELKVKCILGALYVPERGYVQGTYARQFTQQDPANQLSQNYYYMQNTVVKGIETSLHRNGKTLPKISERLGSVPQLGSGIMPAPNPYVGASLCTFVFAGIKPGAAHPVLNLMKGPLGTPYRNKDGSLGRYQYVAHSELANTGTVGDGSSAPQYETPISNFSTVDYPLVPSVKNARWSDAPVLETYNIWEHVNVDSLEVGLQYITYKGYKYPNGYKGPTIRQVVNANATSSLEVSAQNSQAILRRIFPISRDTMYSGAKLYYGVPNGQFYSRDITARGGVNCGFQMQLRHGAPSTATNPLFKQNTSNITIEWGDSTPVRNKAISKYKLVLIPGQGPQLYFLHPVKNKWVSFPLKGPIFGAGNFNVYVHYAGPALLIGFDENINQWNVFLPLSDENDYNGKIEHYISENAEIYVGFNNITASFNYGGMAFNNYHPERILEDGVLYQDEDLGFIRVNMTCPTSKSVTLEPNTINSYFQKHRCLGISQQDFTEFERSAAYYGDWRAASNELQFIGETTQIKNTGDASTSVTALTGFVVFRTTIEGPVWFQIANSDQGTPTNSQGTTGTFQYVPYPNIVHKLDWGDVSEYIKEPIQITYDALGNSSSVLKSTAQLRLTNLGLDERGSRILEALENNTLAITISAGYEDEFVYFEGVIDSLSTTRQGDSIVTILQATDVANTCLDDIPFLNIIYFGGLRYGRIIDYSMGCSGFGDYYRRESGTAEYNRGMNLRLNQTLLHEGTASNLLSTKPSTPIKTVLESALGLVIGERALPILYWDYDNQQIAVVSRYNTNYRDSIRFLATPDANNITYLPQAGGAHTILTQDGYRTSINYDTLLAAYTVWGMNAFDSTVDFADKSFETAYSLTALDRLKRNPLGTKGYLGYRKQIIQSKNQVLPDQRSLQNWLKSIEPFLKQTYQDISFKCYVTHPLKHYGHFNIETFVGDDRRDSTDIYIYKQITYSIEPSNNYITADVKGERHPYMLSASQAQSQVFDGD